MSFTADQKRAEAEVAAEKERQQRARWLRKVSENGDELKNAPSQLRADYEFVLEAVAQKEEALTAFLHLMPSLGEDAGFLKAARRTVANQYRTLIVRERDNQEFMPQKNCGSLNTALDDGFTKLIDADWLIKCADEDKKLDQCLSLPEKEAFYEGPIWHGNIPSEAPDAFGKQKTCTAGVLLVVLSYLWERPDEPDPGNKQLHDFAGFLRFLKGTFEYRNWRIVVFWDWASTVQGDPERTDSQYEMLQDISLWYAHPSTIVVQNKRFPEGRDEKMTFERSGWTTFEDGVSRMVKTREKVLDLQAVSEWLNSADANAVYHTGDKKVPFLAADLASPVLKRNSFNAMVKACVPIHRRRLPLAPKRFNSKMKRARFTRAADKALVQKKYSDMFASTLGRTTQLVQFEKMGVGPSEEERDERTAEWKEFVTHVIPRCRGKLVEVSFAGNPQLQMDLNDLLEQLPPTLEVLRLRKTGCFGKGPNMNWKKVPKLELLDVEHAKVSGTKEDIAASIQKARVGVVENPKACEVITTLRLAHVCRACCKCCGLRCCRCFWLCYLWPSGHTARVLEETELVVNTGAAAFEAEMTKHDG